MEGVRHAGVQDVIEEAATKEFVQNGAITIRAQYLVAADGAHSSIRDQLGIEMQGHGSSECITIYFKADLREMEASATSAERYSDGRVFLVGDAAHTMPPTGGWGGNTGVADAHNLAWKLAKVLNGAADSKLLDSYDAERRPAGLMTMEHGLRDLCRSLCGAGNG